jgi:hypothetical protein
LCELQRSRYLSFLTDAGKIEEWLLECFAELEGRKGGRKERGKEGREEGGREGRKERSQQSGYYLAELFTFKVD